MSSENIEWKERKSEDNKEYTGKELEIVEIIKTIYDPEIPVNIFDLGLIYSININDKNTVKINMTLTSPFCPVAESLPGEVRKKVETMKEIKSAKVEVTFDPPWNVEMMSDEAKVKLNMF